MASVPPVNSSPKWSATAKTVVGLTGIAIVIALLVYFRSIVGPLLLAIILAYSLQPLAAYVNRTTPLNWRWSVNIVFLLLIILLLGILTISGFAIFQQFQSLIFVVNFFTDTLPHLVEELSTQTYAFGPFPFSLSQYDLTSLTNQLLNTLQPIIGQVGTLVSSLATGALTVLAWALFVLVIAYFLLAQTGKMTDELIQLDIPGYNEDIQRLTTELRRIWNVFLRGQLLIFILTVFVYSILLTVLGLRYSLAIALMAGLARFIPYIGPFIVWCVTVLVALFQGDNYLGLVPWQYALLVLSLCVLLDQILDNIVVPRLQGRALGVHPAAVLVAALVAAKLIGLVGLVLAAPVLASMVLISRYVTRKMLDLDPWAPRSAESTQLEFPWVDIYKRSREWLNRTTRR
jgi:predicted PurR-regulated permease PerM